MNYKKSSNISEELHDRIISVAYGGATYNETRQIEKLASENEDVQQLLNQYRSTANAVHSIQKEEYIRKLKFETNSESSKSILDDFYLILIGKPVITVVVAILLISAITFSLFSNRELSYEGYTIAEVEKANFESKQALLIINKIFNETEERITNDILINEVSKPIRKGMNTINKLFYKEIKNEQSEKKS